MKTLKGVSVEKIRYDSAFTLSTVSFTYYPQLDPSEFEIFKKRLDSVRVFKLYMVVSDGENSTDPLKASLYYDLVGSPAGSIGIAYNENYLSPDSDSDYGSNRSSDPVSVFAAVRSKYAGTFTGEGANLPASSLHRSRGNKNTQTFLGSYDLEFGGQGHSFIVDVSYTNVGKDFGYSIHALYVIMNPPTRKFANQTTVKKSFLSPFTCLLDNPMNSDVTLKANGREWPVHKCNLSARSPVFSAMFNGNLKESTANSVEIEDVDSNAFDLMIKYIYRNEVEDMQNLEEELLFLADRYDLPDLKKICEVELMKKHNFQNCLSLLLTGMKFNVESLVGWAKSFITENFLYLCRTVEWERFVEENAKLSVELTISYSRSVYTK